MDVTELDEDVMDAIGEIANMVAGSLKIAFGENGQDIELAIPTTIVRKSFETSSISGAHRVVVQFTMNGNTFMIELKYIDSNAV